MERGKMTDERVLSRIEAALHDLAQVDRTLDAATRLTGNGEDGDVLPPWQAAHVWVGRAMCLLIDSLEGVEDTEFSDLERVPVARTKQPYTHLSARYQSLSDRCRELAQEHEEGI